MSQIGTVSEFENIFLIFLYLYLYILVWRFSYFEIFEKFIFSIFINSHLSVISISSASISKCEKLKHFKLKLSFSSLSAHSYFDRFDLL